MNILSLINFLLIPSFQIISSNSCAVNAVKEKVMQLYYFSDEEDGDIIKSRRATRERPMSFSKMEDVKSRWETGSAAKKEERREERKQEIQAIRSRVFMVRSFVRFFTLLPCCQGDELKILLSSRN